MTASIIATTAPIVSTGGKIFVLDVALDLVAVTTADSTSWSITDTGGSVLSSGTLTYVSSMPVTGYTAHAGWYANVTWPATPQFVHIYMNITKTSVLQSWHALIAIDSFAGDV